MSDTENMKIPEAAVEAAKSAIWDLTGLPVPFEWQRDIIARAALEAAAPHMLDTRVVSEDRKVDIYRTSDRPGVSHEQVTINSLEDLEAICAKYETEVVITVGKDGRLDSIEIVDDYRE